MSIIWNDNLIDHPNDPDWDDEPEDEEDEISCNEDDYPSSDDPFGIDVEDDIDEEDEELGVCFRRWED